MLAAALRVLQSKVDPGSDAGVALKRIWIAVILTIQFEFWQGQRQIPSSFFSPACSQLLCEAWQSKVAPKAVAWVALKRIWIAVGWAIQIEF